MNTLRRVYALELPAKVEKVEQCFSLLRRNSADWDLLRTLQRLVHNLVGSGATFGFPMISEKAGVLNATLKSILSGISKMNDALLQQMGVALNQLKEASLKSLPAPTALWGDFRIPTPPPSLVEENRPIFLIAGDDHLVQELQLWMGYFGYTVETFEEVSQLETGVTRKMPSAIIVDLDATGRGSESPQDLLNVRTRLGPKGAITPIVFISSGDTLESRLAAVRAGGSAYCTKPVDAAFLADKLDTLTHLQDTDPYRVLIVEDDVLEAKEYATILESAGIVTAKITDPMQVMPSLIEFRPDLILMDIFMPLCSGMELAAVIRQQEAYLGIPIIFCSVEKDLSKQFEALLLGGDDFLMKPVSPERLVSMVTSRALRGRILLSHIVHDGLTGLLNHTSIKRRLNLEMDRARRHNERLSYAMIDIDGLKKINDIYGHVAGDRVINTVSRLLRQRLRKTDIIGRYGGDEFSVILIGTDTASAVKILDEIRASFSQILYQMPGTEFSVTLSGGVASFPEHSDMETLHAVSDKALLQSKARGGNQITTA